MIDYHLLHALAAVVSQQGFEKAAQKLCITQSAVSRRIRQLELYLGEPVLIRSQPPIATATGQRLLNHLQQVLQLEASLGVVMHDGLSPEHPLSVRLATNADSLATWLPMALVVPEYIGSDSKFRLSFDLLIEDQTISLKRMKAGEVMICICSNSTAVNGGLVSELGSLRYRAVASPSFIQGYRILSLADLKHAPCLIFDQNDLLQHEFMNNVVGGEPNYIHLCPSSEGFRQSILAGLGFGLLPELQLGDALDSGELVDLCPGYVLDTPLFWHYWQTESPQLKKLRMHALNVAKHQLIQSVT